MCKIMKDICRNHKVEYVTYDADAPEHQAQLDQWGIDEMPVMQIIDDNDNVKHQFFPGLVSIRAITIMMGRIAARQVK